VQNIELLLPVKQ